MLINPWIFTFICLANGFQSATNSSSDVSNVTSSIAKDTENSIYPSSWGFPYKLHGKGGNSFAGLIRIPYRKVGEQTEHYKGARITQSSHYELEYILGRKIIFICVAEGTPRPAITWYKDGVELYAHNYFQVHEWEIEDRKLKSKMEIDPATPMDVGYYECQANNEFAFDFRGFRTKYKATL